MIAPVPEARKNSQLSWYWELLYVLVRRNLKKRYRGSILGIYWSLLSPLIMTGVYTAIFSKGFLAYYDNNRLSYALAAFTGLVVINFFSSSTSQALTSVVENGSIVNKIRLPLFIFPLSFIGGNIFQLLMGIFPLLAVMTFWVSKNIINVVSLLLPLSALTLVCTGVGLFVGALYVFFRDLPYFYEVITAMLLISSPIFYPADFVPVEVRRYLIINPLFPIIESIRQIILSGNLPDIGLILHALLSGCIVFTLGAIAFRIWQDSFMDLL